MAGCCEYGNEPSGSQEVRSKSDMLAVARSQCTLGYLDESWSDKSTLNVLEQF
jgi:hypothetical protein